MTKFDITCQEKRVLILIFVIDFVVWQRGKLKYEWMNDWDKSERTNKKIYFLRKNIVFVIRSFRPRFYRHLSQKIGIWENLNKALRLFHTNDMSRTCEFERKSKMEREWIWWNEMNHTSHVYYRYCQKFNCQQWNVKRNNSLLWLHRLLRRWIADNATYSQWKSLNCWEKRLTIFGLIAFIEKPKNLKYELSMAYAERYLIFKVYTVYGMWPWLKILSEFFFFHHGRIEIAELYKKKYIVTFRSIFYEHQNFGFISSNVDNNCILSSFHKICF
jgi:hypothetical protein